MSLKTNSKTLWVRPSESLRHRLLLFIGLGLALTFFLIGFAIYSAIARAERQAWQAHQQDAAANTSQVINSFINRQWVILGLLSRIEPQLLQEHPEIVRDWLLTSADLPELLEVVVLNRKGELIAGTAQDRSLLSNPLTVQQANWFVQTKTNQQPTIGGVQISPSDYPYMIFAYPTPYQGVVASRVNMQLLWDVVAGVHFGETGQAYIVDETGQLIAHRQTQYVLDVTSLAVRPEWLAIVSADNQTWSGQYTNLTNQNVIGLANPIPQSSWVLITEITQREANTNARRALSAIGLSFVFCTTFALMGVLITLNRYLFLPLDQLRSRSQRIANGQFSERLPVTRHDEMGHLAHSFNEMSNALAIRDTRIAAQTRALAQEVKERKVAQENLQRLNAELVQSAHYKDQFLATMSHELRTPLNAILGMSEALLVPVYGPLNEQQEKAISHVRESGQHLLSLIDDILDLSKIAAGRAPLEVTSVRVNMVVQAALRMIRPMVTQKRIVLSSYVDPSAQTIMADDRRLKQIIVNLLNNAVKFTPDGGRVGLEVKGMASEGVMHFTISDTGIGISKEDMGQLFEPFVQLDGGLSRQYGGTGLGLALVNRLVDLHGGSISVESERNKGCRFTVMLPWSEAVIENQEAQNYPVLEEGESVAKGASILLAEDREANILTLLDYLTIKGFDVSVARNGRQAVEMNRTHRPDLILMDIQMPELNGLEAIKEIRAEQPQAKTPIIALTALAMPGDRERCIAAGANDYISKPVSLRHLVEVIEVQLGQRRPSSATLF